jgi:hypothetical protein
MCFGPSIRPARAPRRVTCQSATRTAGCEMCWSWRRLPPIPKGGTVYVFPAGEVPGGGSAAALFRYPAQAQAVPPAATGVLVMVAVDPVAGQAARVEQLSTGEDGEADALAHLWQDRIGQQSGRS